MQENMLGELLILNKLISREQFDQALDIQQRTPGQPIGQILCQHGFLSSKDLKYVLDHNHKRLKLGEILVSQHLIDEGKLNSALKLSKEKRIPLGKALIKQHLLENEQLARAIALQHDMKFVSLSGVHFDPELSDFVNATFAQRHRIVPIRCRDGCLTIAVAYPIQPDELAELEKWCQMRVVQVIAKESDIVISQQRIFKTGGVAEHSRPHIEHSADQLRDGTTSGTNS
jgi:hypothetical protein